MATAENRHEKQPDRDPQPKAQQCSSIRLSRRLLNPLQQGINSKCILKWKLNPNCDKCGCGCFLQCWDMTKCPHHWWVPSGRCWWLHLPLPSWRPGPSEHCAFGSSSLGAANSHCHSTEALLQACPVPESRGRLCSGCWPPAPGSLSPATHPQARPRPNSPATGWRWLLLGREGFCQFVIKSQHCWCQD